MNHTSLMIEGMLAKMSEDRKASAPNLRLGGLIDSLAALDPSLPIQSDDGNSFAGFDSYRGYYEDLALEPSGIQSTVGAVLAEARKAVGEMFTGYKGGDFWMTKNTVLWIANYGDCGKALVAVRPEKDRVVLETASDFQ
jgi:hypothetical protein